MTKDEKVDGGRVAADILRSMPVEKRKRIMQSIAERSPEAHAKIEANIVTFEDIKDLEDQGIQVLISKVVHKDLVLALKLAEDAVKEALLRNMSERKREVVLQDLAALPLTRKGEVLEAQGRIAKVVDQLRTLGLIRHARSEDEWV